MVKNRRKWTVYLLRCRGGSLYAGLTNDLEHRLAMHAAGRGSRYTRSHLPVQLVWSRAVRNATAARKLEAAIKKMKKGEKEMMLSKNTGERKRKREKG